MENKKKHLHAYEREGKKLQMSERAGKRGFYMNTIQLPPARNITGEPLLFLKQLE